MQENSFQFGPTHFINSAFDFFNFWSNYCNFFNLVLKLFFGLFFLCKFSNIRQNFEGAKWTRLYNMKCFNLENVLPDWIFLWYVEWLVFNRIQSIEYFCLFIVESWRWLAIWKQIWKRQKKLILFNIFKHADFIKLKLLYENIQMSSIFHPTLVW